jgi:hypothetical protein
MQRERSVSFFEEPEEESSGQASSPGSHLDSGSDGFDPRQMYLLERQVSLLTSKLASTEHDADEAIEDLQMLRDENATLRQTVAELEQRLQQASSMNTQASKTPLSKREPNTGDVPPPPPCDRCTALACALLEKEAEFLLCKQHAEQQSLLIFQKDAVIAEQQRSLRSRRARQLLNTESLLQIKEAG